MRNVNDSTNAVFLTSSAAAHPEHLMGSIMLPELAIKLFVYIWVYLECPTLITQKHLIATRFRLAVFKFLRMKETKLDVAQSSARELGDEGTQPCEQCGT